MPELKFNGLSYTVNHAVKGPNYIHGYDSSGIKIVGFEGVVNFSQFEYDGTYMSPEQCITDAYNNVKFHENKFKRGDGTEIGPLVKTFTTTVSVPNTEWNQGHSNYYWMLIPAPFLKEDDNPIVDVCLSEYDEEIDSYDYEANKSFVEAWSCIADVSVPADGYLYIAAYGQKPEVNFNMLVKVVR